MVIDVKCNLSKGSMHVRYIVKSLVLLAAKENMVNVFIVVHLHVPYKNHIYDSVTSLVHLKYSKYEYIGIINSKTVHNAWEVVV